MSKPHISLIGITYVLPNGRVLFQGLDERFGAEATALVGRNGIGKSVLAKIMAGLLAPTSGVVSASGGVFYLDQIVTPSEHATVADLVGLRGVLDALARIDAGEGNDADLALADGKWDMADRFARELANAGLGYLEAGVPASRLSGGECTRAALIGAFLSGADFLILDEPTNHLDARNRASLIAYLKTWTGGLVTISHDRRLLEEMEAIVELTANGLKRYGGGYSFYAEARDVEKRALMDRLEHVKTERKQAARDAIVKRERQQHRAADGKKKADRGGIPKIMLGGRRMRSEITTGKMKLRDDAALESLAAEELEAFRQADIADPVVLIPPLCAVHESKVVLELRDLVLPYGTKKKPATLTIMGPERVALTGPNGCGKTTLFRALTGELSPVSGTCELKVRASYLDQYASSLDGEKSAEASLRDATSLGEGEARTRLAQVGLARERALLPTKILSGGERLKVALLCALMSDPAPQLLLLDEPTNHLDLDSVLSVEGVLRAYTGAMIVISHDDIFLDAIGVTRRIVWNDD